MSKNVTLYDKEEKSIVELIDYTWELEQDEFRPHLGASVIGMNCHKALWYSFRWVKKIKHEGRLKRLFNRGKREEFVAIENLRRIGCHIVIAETYTKFDLRNHIAGTADGIIMHGLPSMPKEKLILEIKTHSEKSFNAISESCVKNSKPLHYIQMQIYMHGLKIGKALYYAVCKNTDRIYIEIIEYDQEVAEYYLNKALEVIANPSVPTGVSQNPSWYQCKLCDYHDVCHEIKQTTEVNCRTCAHSTPTEKGVWHCAVFNADGIPVDFQLKGCDQHVPHPDLVAYPINIMSREEMIKLNDGKEDTITDFTACFDVAGTNVLVGKRGQSVYTSSEFLANPIACSMSSNEVVNDFRSIFGAEICN